eukprot:scaffold12831_cov71-Phaeocystis_antarctica.AAC.1
MPSVSSSTSSNRSTASSSAIRCSVRVRVRLWVRARAWVWVRVWVQVSGTCSVCVSCSWVGGAALGAAGSTARGAPAATWVARGAATVCAGPGTGPGDGKGVNSILHRAAVLAVPSSGLYLAFSSSGSDFHIWPK